MNDFTERDEDLHLGPDRIFTSPTALALYNNLLAAFEGAPGAPRLARAALNSEIRPWILIEEKVIASATANATFSALQAATFKEHWLRLINVVPASDGVTGLIRVDTGSGIDTGNVYTRALQGLSSSGTGFDAVSTSATAIQISNTTAVVNAASAGLDADIFVNNLASTSHSKAFRFDSQHPAATSHRHFMRGTGVRTGTTNAITQIQFLFNTGNIASGILRLYGRE